MVKLLSLHRWVGHRSRQWNSHSISTIIQDYWSTMWKTKNKPIHDVEQETRFEWLYNNYHNLKVIIDIVKFITEYRKNNDEIERNQIYCFKFETEILEDIYIKLWLPVSIIYIRLIKEEQSIEIYFMSDFNQWFFEEWISFILDNIDQWNSINVINYNDNINKLVLWKCNKNIKKHNLYSSYFNWSTEDLRLFLLDFLIYKTDRTISYISCLFNINHDELLAYVNGDNKYYEKILQIVRDKLHH